MVTIGSKPFAVFRKFDRLPLLDASVLLPVAPAVPASSASAVELPSTGIWGPEVHHIQLGDLWHRRLMHPGAKAMHNLAQLDLMPQQAIPPTFCDACVQGKMHRVALQPPRQRARRPLEILHLDVVGPLPTSLPPIRACYALVITDDYSRLRIVALSATKASIPDVLLAEIAKLQAQLAPHKVVFVVSLRSDNGGEFTSARLASILASVGIQSQFTPPYTPQSNGLAERSNRAIIERVRTCLAATSLPVEVWGEIAFAATYVLNLTPTKGVPGRGIPLEAFTGDRVDILAHLRAFGTPCYVLAVGNQKLAPRAVRGRMVGYASLSRGRTAAYRILLDATPLRVITSVDVVFASVLLRLPTES
ncbi:MAG: DDE-type integrase/transposase/recombinase, partial [Rhodospirillales bacterium]|nr:DDE-type integrase/transposase/recombinase [Rhodospirillales bacterium]